MVERPEPELVYSWQGPPSLELWREPVVLPSGLEYTGHRLVASGGRPGVVVLAHRDGRMLFVRSLRPAVGRVILELPRGFGEADPADPDGPVSDALRELREETGYSARAIRVRGEYTADTSILPSRVAVVECAVDPGDPAGTDGEVIDAEWLPQRQIRALVTDGILADAHTLSALMLAPDLWNG